MPTKTPLIPWQPIDKRRIEEAMRRVEASPKNRVRREKGPTPNLGAGLALTTSTIPARSGSSPAFTAGKGTGTLLAVSISGSLVATTSTTAIGVSLYHMGTATIASGRVVQWKWVGPIRIIDVDYC